MKKQVQNEPCAKLVPFSVQQFEEPQTTTKQNGERKVSAETEQKQSKKEMDEDEKIRKLRESFEAMGSSVTIDRNM